MADHPRHRLNRPDTHPNGQHPKVCCPSVRSGTLDIPTQIVRSRPRHRCEECEVNWADYPSKLCPGCEAYRDHTGQI